MAVDRRSASHSCRYLIGSATVAVGWSAYVVHALQEAGCPIDRRFIEAPIVYNSDLGVRFPHG